MISEKTVEMNLTIELVNYISNRLNRPCYVWGPTLRQEARWGFDAAVGLQGRYMYIQYKRAYDEPGGHKYLLNRTAGRNQHQILCALEASGRFVRYGLPRFTSILHIANNRRRLLTNPHSAWFRPSALVLPGGPVGHHDLHLHGTHYYVTSEPSDVPEPEDIFSVLRAWEEQTPVVEVTPEFAERENRVFDKIFGRNGESISSPNADGLLRSAIFFFVSL